MRYQSLKFNLIFFIIITFYGMVSNRERIHNCFWRNIPARAKQIPSSFICKNCKTESFTLWPSQFPAWPSPHPPGLCRAFVILFWKSCKCPTVGLKNIVQIPYPGTTPNLYFPVNKLKIPFLWETSNSPIKTEKTCEPPTQIAPSR